MPTLFIFVRPCHLHHVLETQGRKCTSMRQSCPATSHAGAKRQRRNNNYSFLTSALDGVSGQYHAPAAIYSQEWTHWTGGWVGLSAGLDTEASGKLLCLCRRSSPDRPVCSQTLHWLSYPQYIFSRTYSLQSSNPTGFDAHLLQTQIIYYSWYVSRCFHLLIL
jgi:hypothetical protein